jgi:hypothetical protein
MSSSWPLAKEPRQCTLAVPTTGHLVRHPALGRAMSRPANDMALASDPSKRLDPPGIGNNKRNPQLARAADASDLHGDDLGTGRRPPMLVALPWAIGSLSRLTRSNRGADGRKLHRSHRSDLRRSRPARGHQRPMPMPRGPDCAASRLVGFKDITQHTQVWSLGHRFRCIKCQCRPHHVWIEEWRD